MTQVEIGLIGSNISFPCGAANHKDVTGKEPEESETPFILEINGHMLYTCEECIETLDGYFPDFDLMKELNDWKEKWK